MNAPQPLTQVAYATQAATAATESELDRLLQKGYSPRDMLEGDSMSKMMRLAELMASSKLTVPAHLRDNVGDCFAVVMQAMLWNMDAFAVAQKTHLVSGRLGYEAQLVNAVVQNSGAVRGVPLYEYRGDGQDLECRVAFVLRRDTQPTWGEWLRNGDITTRNSPLWKANVRQQLGYLQIKNWARAFCPGAILGVYTVDELDGIGASEAPTQPRGPQRKSERAAAAPAPAAAAEEPTGEVDPPAPAPSPKPSAAAPRPTPGAVSAEGAISAGQIAYLRKKLESAGVDESAVKDRYQVAGIELLNGAQFDELKAELLAMT